MTRRSVRGVFAGRGFVLFPACAFAVHQLRYELAYGSQASQALASQGHGYLDSLAPWLALLVALGFGSLLGRLARSLAGRDDRRPGRSFGEIWGVAWATLLATFVIQEWLEGVFAAGHPGGVAGIFGHGGFWAVPLAALAGLLVACLLRVASALVAVARGSAGPRLVWPRSPGLHAPASVLPLPRTPLSDRSAGRAPPEPPRSLLA